MEALEDRFAPTATPLATLTAPSTNFLGQDVNLSVSFTNTGNTVGYGPYLDVDLPATGANGPTNDNGVTYNTGSATYLGSPVTTTVLTFDAYGHATHPYAVDSSGNPIILTGTPGDQLIVFQLPFGSFTPGQIPAVIDFTAHISNLAAVGTPLTLTTDAGFQFGNDALNNPKMDPTILGAQASQTLTPTLFTVTKTYTGPEQETATGPNFPHQYVIDVSIAPGQTITNLNVTDLLPNNLQFVAVNSTTIDGTAVATTAISTPSTTTPGGTLTQQFASVTGTGAANDAEVKYTFYVPENDANGNAVLNLTSGAFAQSSDTASATGNWTPLASFLTGGTVTSNNAVNTITDKSIAIQKSVTDLTADPLGPVPGDTLQYTLNIQVSDFFAFQNIVAQDVFSDGQEFDASFTPILTVNGDTFTLNSDAFHNGNYGLTYNTFNPGTGGNQINFDLSNELLAAGVSSGQLLGGALPTGGTGGPNPSATATYGGTTATITFETTILQQYNVQVSPSGDPHVKQGDLLNDNVTVSGDVLNYANLTADGHSQSDTSSASVQIQRGLLSKIIYAVNGLVAANPDTGYTNGVQVAAGDTITYRLRYTVLFGNAETITLDDFLPLPVLLANSVTTFDGTGPTGTPPPVGEAVLGLDDTFTAQTGDSPSLSNDPTANSLAFTYQTSNDPQLRSAVIDILYTVQVNDNPFADGLFLTNEVHESEGSTNNGGAVANSIVQIDLTEPVLTIKKGVVSNNGVGGSYSQPIGPGSATFSAPGSAGVRFTGTLDSSALKTTPIDANLSGIQAGDLVTFADVVQNLGSGLYGADDVSLYDSIPAGFVIPTSGAGLNLEVTDGTGAALPYTISPNGLFASNGGIVLTDPLPAYSATSGQNVVIITYDLQATQAVDPNAVDNSTVTLTNYASEEGGPNFLQGNPLTDQASVQISDASVSKAVINTDQTFTTGNYLAVGETAQFQVTITVPQGYTPGATFTDTLDQGLAFVSLDSMSVDSAALSTDAAGGFGGVLAGATISNDGSGAENEGRTLSLNFGDITNTDRNDATAETITLTYTVVAIDGSTVKRGDTLQNNATWNWDISSATGDATVGIVEPKLTVSVTPSSSTGDGHDSITYTVVVKNPTNANGTDGFDANLTDTLPTGVTYVPGSLQFDGGLTPASLAINSGTIDGSWNTFGSGGSSTFQFVATINASAVPGQQIVDQANIQWTSIPGTDSISVSSYNPLGVERTGSASDPGGAQNTYDANGKGTVTINNIAPVLSIVATSEPSTGNVGGVEQVAIGEVIRYQLKVKLPETVMNSFQLNDVLPTDLSFLDPTQVDVLFTADTPLTQSIGAGAQSSGTTPTFLLPSSSITVNGQSVTFNLGNLVNNDSDNSAAYVTLDFNALVDNTTNNNAGNTKSDSFTVSIGGSPAGASNVVQAQIVAPHLSDTLTVTPGGADDGDTMTYTATFTNNGTETGFDTNFLDTLPSTMTLVGSVTTSLGGATGLHNNTSGNQVNLTFDTLPTSDTVTVTFQATVNTAGTVANPGTVISNSDTITTTTLPGLGTQSNPTGTNTPATTSGAANGERNGSGGVNNLNATGNATFSIYSDTITGTVYLDGNNNGVIDGGENGVGSVSVTLTGVDQLNHAVQMTTVTNSSGVYQFTNLRPGTYTVTKTPVTGLLDGKDSIGTLFGGGNATADVLNTLVIPHGASRTGTGYNFAELVPSTFSGTVYQDNNDNGIINGGENGIANVTITLAGKNDLGATVLQTAVTNSSGYYQFTNLRPSNASGYTITETPPVGLLTGIDTPGSASVQFVPGTTQFKTVLLPNTSDTANNFGELQPSSLSGYVYRDDNNDGSLDNMETGISGVTITLAGTDDLGHAVNKIVTTNATGYYDFTQLRPGNYTITETRPAGFGIGTTTVGSQNGTANGNVITINNFPSNSNGINNDFGQINLPPVITPIGQVTMNSCLCMSLSQVVTFSDPAADGTWTAVVNYGDGSALQTIVIAGPTETFTLQHTYAAGGLYQVGVTVNDSYHQSATTSFLFVDNTTPPTAYSQLFTINDGNVQRSMINSLTLTFNAVVTFDPGAFQLVNQNGTAIGLRAISQVIGNETVVVLQFTTPSLIGGSLADGSYTFTLNGALVHPGGRGTYNGGAVQTFKFFRLFGDVNGAVNSSGAGIVNGVDLALFNAAMRSQEGNAQYVWYLDYNQDCAIDAVDYRYFLMNYHA